MSSAAALAGIAATKVEQSAAATIKAHGSLENAWKWMSQSHLRVDEAKLVLAEASRLIIEGRGEGHRLAQAAIQADLRAKELQLEIRELQEALKQFAEGERLLKQHIDEWAAWLRQ